MILTTKDIIGCGAYADIFRPPQAMLVYKLFVSGRHPTNVGQNLTRPQDDDRRQKTFTSECEAYDRAAQHPFLRNHIPQSFRRCVVEDVTGPAGSVADCYMLDHCYAMEYIAGNPGKLGQYPLDSRAGHIESALHAFHDAGIHHLIDASVFFPDDPDNFKFIDFAMEEYPPFW